MYYRSMRSSGKVQSLFLVLRKYSNISISKTKFKWKTLVSLTGMNVSVNKEGTQANVKIPGFSFHDFDRTGRLNIRNLQSTLTAARFLAYHTVNEETQTSFLEYDKLTSEVYTFMASTRTIVDKELYSLTRREVLINPPKFVISIQLGYVGRSSLNSIAQLKCEETGQVYVRNTNQVVVVDKSTRKPTKMAEWWQKKYQNSAVSNEPLVIKLIEKPAETHNYPMKVPWTDIDNYKHTNYVAYIRYCLDAALDASFSSFYSKVRGDFLSFNVKEMNISYKGESVANEELVVYTWENSENPYLLHFSIERSGNVIFQNSIEVFEKEVE